MWNHLNGNEAPVTRGKHSATLVDNYIYILGGRGGSLALKDFWRYHIETNKWEKIQAAGGDTPPALQEHTAIAWNRCIYVFGGEMGYSSTETPLWVYDTVKNWWRKIAGTTTSAVDKTRRRNKGGGASPRGRRGHTAHLFGNIMLVYGGYQDLKGSTNEIWAFHFESESWHHVCSSGPSRHRHISTLYDSKLYVYGGMCDLTEKADLYVFDTVCRRWSQIRCKNSPGAVCGAAGVRLTDRMVLIGGERDDQLSDEIWIYYYERSVWERLECDTPGPAPRTDSAALVLPAGILPRQPRKRRPTQTSAVQQQNNNTPGLLRELAARLSVRCSYTALPPAESSESIPQAPPSMVKSQSAYGPVSISSESDFPRDLSVPDFTTQVHNLIHLDSDEDLKKSSVKFKESDTENTTSGYTSTTEVLDAPVSFENPNYIGPAVAVKQLGTPDSGVDSGDMVEMKCIKDNRRNRDEAMFLVLVGGREKQHVAHIGRPLTLWCRYI